MPDAHALHNLDKIEHTVVLMLENRSFDSLLGFLYHDANNVSPRGQAFEGLTGNETNPLNGQELPVFPIPADDPYAYVMPGADPGEGYADTLAQLYGQPPHFNGPTNRGFVQNYDWILKNKDSKWKPEDGLPPIYPHTEAHHIMGMFTGDLLPVTWALARGFAVCDHWYCDAPTQTIPNRAFIACGTSQGVLKDYIDGQQHVYTARTIFNSLSDAGFSWKLYGYDQPPLTPHGLSQMHSFLKSPERSQLFGTFADFQKDAQAGNLAEYVFLEPEWGVHGNSMHPNYNVAAGEALIHAVYRTLRDAPSWNDTLFVLIFDEHGGTYDHVCPPAAVQPNAEAYNAEHNFKFDRYGVRVPAILISPHIPAGTVFRAPSAGSPLSHCSVLATLEAKYGLRPLTERDRLAPQLGAVLELEIPRAADDDPLADIAPPVFVPPQSPVEHVSHLSLLHARYLHQQYYAHDQNAPPMPALRTSREASGYCSSLYRKLTAFWDAQHGTL